MGQAESTAPELMDATTYNFAIAFKPMDKCQIINAGQNLVQIVEKILHDEAMVESARYKGSTKSYKLRLQGTPFSPGGGSSVNFKSAFLKILNQIYHSLHLSPFVSSDLCLQTDTSTVFFKKSEIVGMGNYVCIAPSGHDSVDLIDMPTNLQNAVIYTLTSYWGINESKTKEKRHNCTRIELKGNPWGYGASGENATHIRRLLLKLIEVLKLNMYRFMANISMKGTCDMMFFQYDPSIIPDPSQTFIMYLSKTDRLRFIDAPQNLTDSIRSLVNQTWKGGITNECIHNDALEFKLKGKPWHAHSYDATPSRYLISTIFVEMRKANTKCIGTLDISRRTDDKSIFIFESSPIYKLSPGIPIKWTCFYFCGRGKLMLIGVHNDIVNLLNHHLVAVTEGPGSNEGNLVLWRFTNYVFSYGANSCREIFIIALLQIYEQMRSLGWELVSSADVSSIVVKRNDNYVSYDAHSWYFINTYGTLGV